MEEVFSRAKKGQVEDKKGERSAMMQGRM